MNQSFDEFCEDVLVMNYDLDEYYRKNTELAFGGIVEPLKLTLNTDVDFKTFTNFVIQRALDEVMPETKYLRQYLNYPTYPLNKYERLTP